MSLDADVHVRRGSFDLDLTLAVADEETVVILGPNGAGKTTLLQTLAGLVGLDAGQVRLGGEMLDDPQQGVWVPTERRAIGYVFQEHLLFPHLSALDNVAFGLRARGARRADARRAAQAWLDRFELAGHAADRPGALSGGQAQRVALARALAPAPRLLLLDEPLAALDATTRIEVRRDLGRHLAAVGGPRLIVTHDPIDVMALADRVVVLEHGQVLQSGTLSDLRSAPRSRYVADLVGINLYRGTLSGSRVTLPGGGELVVVNDDARTGEVFAAVRPEAVALHRHRPDGSPRNTWPARVTTIDHEGPRARVTLGGAITITAEITERAAAELGVVVGADTWVSVKATEIETYAA